MSHRNLRHGFMMLDLIIGAGVSLLIGAATLQLMNANYIAHDAVGGQNNVNAMCRSQMDTLADGIRNAQSGPSHQVFSTAAANDVTIYTNASGNTTRLWLDTTVSPAQLKRIRTTAGTASTPQVIGTGVTSLQFTYYPAGGWATTDSPHLPSAGELPTIGAVKIKAQMAINGYSRSFTTVVRLRNSPYVPPVP